jgi:hypothetical protein
MRLINVLTELRNVYGTHEAVDVLYTFVATLPEHERFFRSNLSNILDTNTSFSETELDLFKDRYSGIISL